MRNNVIYFCSKGSENVAEPSSGGGWPHEGVGRAVEVLAGLGPRLDGVLEGDVGGQHAGHHHVGVGGARGLADGEAADGLAGHGSEGQSTPGVLGVWIEKFCVTVGVELLLPRWSEYIM